MDLIREKFSENLKKLPVSANCALMSTAKYKQLVHDVKNVKSTGRKSPSDFWLLKHYDVIEVEGVDKLIYPVTAECGIKYYVTEDELCEVLYKTHCSIGHGGRDRMLHELNRRYKNITQQQILIFLRCCEVCQLKKSGVKKGIVVKPMVYNDLNSRCQLDLIDLQSQPDREYKFIFVYQDHLTKFVVLRPLSSKRAEEVAHNLIDVFTTFGAPCVLQSDNGREFCNSIIESLKQLWPELQIVHGKPRHSQSQGSVERANQDIENMLFTWLKDNNTTKWSVGLRFVQFMKNRAFHSGIKRSPYEAMFGCAPRFGIKNCGLPDSILQSFTKEEDLESCIEQNFEIESTSTSNNCHSKCELCNSDINDLPTSTPTNVRVCELCQLHDSTTKQRKDAKQCLEQQAKRMRIQSDANFPDPAVGDTVRVQIPDVDRAKTDARSVLACVLEVTEDKFFKLGTSSGILKQLYARSQFSLCHEKFLKLEDIPTNVISLRSVASAQSLGDGQGFTRCHCTQKCRSKRCLCVKKGLLCNSKCHGSNTCCNK